MTAVLTDLDTYAQWAWLSGRIGEAIDLYVDLVRGYPKAAHVHFKLGFLYLAVHDYQSAVRHFTIEIDRYTATPLSPGTSPTTSNHQRTFLLCAHMGRRDAHAALQDATSAEQDELFVNNRGGHSPATLVAMGALFCHFGMHQRAEYCFDRSARIDADDPDYLVAHGELCLAQKRYTTAVTMFAKCRSRCSSASTVYYRALLGEGAALLRQHKLQDAVILILQVINNLRTQIECGEIMDSYGVDNNNTTSTMPRESPASKENTLMELVHLYHQAINLYGGLCLMKGELRLAIDTYYSVIQSTTSLKTDSFSFVQFQLPTICVLPGTKTAEGELVDSTKISTKNLREVVRHLNEIEWRYGPDPCLYFHRANVYRALGELTLFVHNLSLVESMDPGFVNTYQRHECLGDFFDVDTMAWIPLQLIKNIHTALEKREYIVPSVSGQNKNAAPQVTKSPTRRKSMVSIKTKMQSMFSERGIFEYFQERIQYGSHGDEYAQVFQLDSFRRLPDAKTRTCHSDQDCTQPYLSQWEGMMLDKQDVMEAKVSQMDPGYPVRELVKSVVGRHGNHPCVHMIAGMIELELFNAQTAHFYFTEAIRLIDMHANLPIISSSSSTTTSSPLAKTWQQNVMQRVKYYCLVWRSMTSRMKIEMESAVEDLNMAAAISFEENDRSNGDPLLLVQRSIIMLLHGHLKPAHKLLHQLNHQLKHTKRYEANKSDAVDVIDMFANIGLNSFHLLAISHVSGTTFSGRGSGVNVTDNTPLNRTVNDRDERRLKEEEEREAKEEEIMAASIVNYVLNKKGGAAKVVQTETLDKFYSSGIVKLASSGSMQQAAPFFHAILSIDETYLPPTNFASLELLRCKEQDFMDEKLYNCFARLQKRSKWLQKKVQWKFEALIDANLAHAYLPTDIETLWHRARLVQEQHNYDLAINDLSDCLELMNSQFMWRAGKKDQSKMKAIFPTATKKTQWLQLLLERGCLEMTIHNWEKSIPDLTMVILQAGKNNYLLQASAYEARSTCFIQLKRYEHAIQDLQHLITVSKERKKLLLRTSMGSEANDPKYEEDQLLHCILIGNLYCQLALDQAKISAGIAQKHTAFTPSSLRQLSMVHFDPVYITRARSYYDEALSLVPEHFLALYFQGRMLALTSQRRQSITSLGECLRYHPTFLPALFLRGCVYAQEKLFVLALADFYRIRHRAPLYPNLHTAIGYCHFEQGSMAKAVASLTDAIQQSQRDVDALYMRGCALQELFVLEKAERDFTRILTIQPDHFRAIYQRSVCFVLRQQYILAIEDLAQAIRTHPEWKEAWVLRAYASFCAGRYDDAVIAYGLAAGKGEAQPFASASKQDATLLFYRALANMHANKHAEALEDFDLALKRDNQSYVVYVAKAFLLAKMGKREDAMKVLIHALPHYRTMPLMPAIEVHDSERANFLKTQNTEPIATSIMNPFTTSTTVPSKNPNADSKVQMITANASVLFRCRQQTREDQMEQAQCGPQRHQHVTMVADQSNGSVLLSADGNTPSFTKQRCSVHISTAPTNTNSTGCEENARVIHKRVCMKKFQDVVKKLVNGNRVLRALDSIANAKIKKNEQKIRLLSETMQPKTKVAWPRGTLTTNILMWAFNALGSFYLHNRKVDDALMALSLAIQAHPYHAMTFFNRGNLYLHTGTLLSAVDGFQDAIDIEGNCFQAINNMGVAYFRMKRLEDAHEAFTTGLLHAEKDMHRAVILYNLGVIFQAQDKLEEAFDFYQQAIALDNTRREFFNNRSTILHQQLKFTLALEDYRRALSLDEQNHQCPKPTSKPRDREMNCIEARLNSAQLHISMGNCTTAIRDLNLALSSLAYAREHTASVSDGSVSNIGLISSTLPLLGNSNCGEAEEAVAAELLAFCEKWRDALCIAVKDFLFGFDAFPCFANFQLFSLFTEQLKYTCEKQNELWGHDCSDGDLPPRMILPLPLLTTSCFDLENILDMWDDMDSDLLPDANEANGAEYNDMEAFKRHMLAQPYKADLMHSIQQCRLGDYVSADHFLLRAHYKTDLNSHEEYFFMLWRVVVTQKIEVTSSLQKDGSMTGLLKAISLLRRFLDERCLPEEKKLMERENEGFNEEQNEINIFVGAPIDGDDTDELSEQDLQWKHQLKVIRADAYTYLGCLEQLNGNRLQAHKHFVKALRLRNDHVVALVNFLQLSIVDMEYETALDAILRIFELVFGRSTISSVVEDGNLIVPWKGLLNADRSVEMMVPGMKEAIACSHIAELGAQMLQTFKEYRGLLTAHIEMNLSHIFRKQGSVARIVDELRTFLREHEAKQTLSNMSNNDHALQSSLDLDAFNRILDEYSVRLVKALPDGGDNGDTVSDDFRTSFESEFTRVCEEITRSLPAEAIRTHQEFVAATGNSTTTVSKVNLPPESRLASCPMTPIAPSSPRKLSEPRLQRPMSTPVHGRYQRKATMQ